MICILIFYIIYINIEYINVKKWHYFLFNKITKIYRFDFNTLGIIIKVLKILEKLQNIKKDEKKKNYYL